MTEVFKTNVSSLKAASMVQRTLTQAFPECEINFDLQDCDRILRIKSRHAVDACSIIEVVNHTGYHAEVLPDEVPTKKVGRYLLSIP